MTHIVEDPVVLLGQLLENELLPCKEGKRMAQASEFTLFDVETGEDGPIATFQHRDSQNFLQVQEVPQRIVIPIVGTFFDRPDPWQRYLL